MKEKNYNIEIIRLVSFIFVIVIHVSNYFSRGYAEIPRAEYIFSVVCNTVARVSVPCFFMISGALLLPDQANLGKTVKRMLRFLAALAFWSFVYYVFNVYYMKAAFNLMEILFVPVEPHLWYLYAMLPIYLVLPFFQIMCKGMTKQLDVVFICMGILITAGIYLSSMMNREPYYDVPLIGDKIYVVYFFAGYFIQKYRKRISWSFSKLLGILIASILCNIVLTAAISMTRGDHYERLLEYGCPLVVISGLSFFTLMLKMQDGNIQLKEKTRKTIDIWCSCSFGVYLIHILFLDQYKKYVDVEQISAWFGIPLLTLVLLLLSFICIRIIRKFPIGKWIT